jgi:glycosyltransferase involved in cell wall biosynthesis
MNNLLTNEKEYSKLSNEVLSKVADLSWDNIAEKFINLIEN